MIWKLEIVKENNGYIVKGKYDGSNVKFTKLFETPEEQDGELEVMQKLICEMMNYFGVYYSKHNKKNLIIKIEENK